jgi:hypothetical protein
VDCDKKREGQEKLSEMADETEQDGSGKGTWGDSVAGDTGLV